MTRTMMVALCLLASVAGAQERSLEIGNATAVPGAIAWVPVIVHGADVLGVQADLHVPPANQVADANGEPLCVPDPGAQRDWSHAGFFPALTCTPGVDCDWIRVLVLDLTTAVFTPLPDGVAAVRCAVRAPTSGSVPIGCTNAKAPGAEVLAGADGELVDCVPGSVSAVGCSAGDVDGDGAVSIGEVIGTVNAALGCER